MPNLTLLGLFFRKTNTTDCNLPYSVIIPLHNKRNEIRKSLESVYNQTRKPNHVYVVDDKSDDGSADVVTTLNYDLKLIKLEKNHGKANAINEILFKYVTDPLVLILDADTYLASDYAENVIRGFTKNVVGVSGRVVSASTGSACQKSRAVENLFGHRVLKAFQARIGGMWVLAGCATIWDAEWLKETGGMPNNTLVEDMELTWRAEQDNSVNYIHEALCYTEDPIDLKSYIIQIYRWYSWRPALSFIDFWKLRRGLKLVISWSILEIFVSLFFMILLTFSATTGNPNYILLSMLIDWFIYAIIAGHEGYKLGKFADTIEGLPYLMILRYVNLIVVLVALIYPKKKWY